MGEDFVGIFPLPNTAICDVIHGNSHQFPMQARELGLLLPFSMIEMTGLFSL